MLRVDIKPVRCVQCPLSSARCVAIQWSYRAHVTTTTTVSCFKARDPTRAVNGPSRSCTVHEEKGSMLAELPDGFMLFLWSNEPISTRKEVLMLVGAFSEHHTTSRKIFGSSTLVPSSPQKLKLTTRWPRPRSALRLLHSPAPGCWDKLSRGRLSCYVRYKLVLQMINRGYG